MGRMFLIEVMVHKIEFENTVKTLPTTDDTIVYISFADIIKSEMMLVNYPTTGFSVIDHDWALGLNMGKTFLFEYNLPALAEHLKKVPLEFTLKLKKHFMGSTQLPWREDFVNMVNLFETIGLVKAVDSCGTVEFLDHKGELVAKMYLYIRMTCFGDRTNCDIILPRGDNHETVIANTKTACKMSCNLESYENLNFFLSTAFYKPAVQYMSCEVFYICARRDIPTIRLGSEEPTNFLELFGQQSDLDVVSISFRPSDQRLYEFLNAISDAPREDNKTSSIYAEEDKAKKQFTNKLKQMKFCKRESCPGNIKFKEYGLGSFPYEKGYLEPISPCTLSHANGLTINYGPGSTFSRPKRADQPFIPPRDAPGDVEFVKSCRKTHKHRNKPKNEPQVCNCLRSRGCEN